jgi:pyruvate, orthophosphate dikinase
VGDRSFPEGTVLSIDGATGDVFEGVASGVATVVPEAKVLLGWARELGIRIGEREEEPGPDAAAAGVASSDDALRVLLIKGYAQPDQLAHALGVPPADGQLLLDGLVADGMAEGGAGSFRLTASGRDRASALIDADRLAWGADGATAALDAFLALDQRMKAVVTDWQTRGPETLNDHSDAGYDASVLGRLADLHRDVETWLEPLAAALPRLARYGERLGGAAHAAAAGNGKFVASPRVDSYHGAWFELHEDLILLAGRTRADEVAAGRA